MTIELAEISIFVAGVLGWVIILVGSVCFDPVVFVLNPEISYLALH